jgi:glycosyltransferase involved in cell wall biosynthesis
MRLRSRIFSARIERYNLRHTRHLIVISRYVTQYFASILSPKTKVYHIPNAVCPSFFELENAGDGRSVLYAGRVIPGKRITDLVQAFAQVSQRNPKAQLRIAGEYHSDAGYAQSLQVHIRRSGLDEQVHLLGALSENEVLDEYSRCDVLVLPSIQETAPMVIAQAMAAGKPVVATAVGGVPEMVDDGFTGFLVKVGDVAGLADALLLLLQDPALRTQMGQAGKQKAIENYPATTVARRTLQVYEAIATGS